MNDGDFKHHLDRYKYNNRYDNVLSSEEHREHAVSILKTYDDRLSNQAYLCGDSISLADLALSPFVRQFANTDRGWFNQVPLPHLLKWLEEILESNLFKACMIKHKQWQPGDEPVFFGWVDFHWNYFDSIDLFRKRLKPISACRIIPKYTWIFITEMPKRRLFQDLSLIHIWRCRRYSLCRSRWSPYH